MANKLPFEKLAFNVIDKKEKPFRLEQEQKPLSELLEASFVVINKPQGPTSHQVAAYVNEVMGTKITGHTGTLDPNVTGVLPVGLNRATILIQGLINTGKEYVCYMVTHDDIPEDKIRAVCEEFVGDIQQLPPVKSAVKRQLRTRTIYYLDVIEVDGRNVLFRVGCQAGTYIRKLCTDIGEKLGCGAHMQQLVRTKAATFRYTDAITMQELTDAMYYYKKGDETKLRAILHPVEKALRHLRKIYINNGAAERLAYGAQLMVPGIRAAAQKIKKDETVLVLDEKANLVCLAKTIMSGKEMLRKQKGQATKTLRVFTQPSN